MKKKSLFSFTDWPVAWRLGSLSFVACLATASCETDDDASAGANGPSGEVCTGNAVRIYVSRVSGVDTLENAVVLSQDKVQSVEGPLRVVDRHGTVLATAEIPPTRPIGVISPEGGGEAVDVEQTIAVVAPWPQGAHAVLLGDQRVEQIACAPRSLGKADDGSAPLAAWQSGDPAERFDVVVLADGYLARDRAQFERDVSQFAQAYLATEPFTTFKGLINIWGFFGASREQGAGSDGVAIDTAFGCAFGCSGVLRLLCCDSSKAHEVAGRAVPSYDAVLVLANDERYGGSGSTALATAAARNDAFVEAAIHELGHQMGLADEYTYTDEGLGGFAAPNCATSRTWTPWQAWRTPETGVDAYEGCGSSSYYRPTESGCMMLQLYSPFCPVCREHIIHKLYERAGGIMKRPIPELWDQTLASGPMTLAVETRGPAELAEFAWERDTTALDVASAKLTLSSCIAGEYKATAMLDSPWVRQLDLQGVQESFSWSVRCSGASSPQDSEAPQDSDDLSPGNGLLLTEYVEESSNNKALELWNAGGSSIDLAQCKGLIDANGSTAPKERSTACPQ